MARGRLAARGSGDTDTAPEGDLEDLASKLEATEAIAMAHEAKRQHEAALAAKAAEASADAAAST